MRVEGLDCLVIFVRNLDIVSVLNGSCQQTIVCGRKSKGVWGEGTNGPMKRIALREMVRYCEPCSYDGKENLR